MGYAAAERVARQGHLGCAAQQRLEAAEISRQTLQRAHSEAIERVAMLTLEHERQYSSLQEKYIQRVRDENQPHAKLVDRAQSAEADAIAYRRRVELLEQSLQSEEDIIRKHQVLEEKLREMEARGEERERYWKDAVAKARAVAERVVARSDERLRSILSEKNSQIMHFKTELEGIMQVAVHLKGGEHGR